MIREATFDDTGTYRYRLVRAWDGTGPRVGFVMLNPSAADAVVDDPTIRRCAGFARSWGYGSLVVVNLFAYRSARPERLLQVDDPVGPENDRHILLAVAEVERLVVAWGCHGAMLGRDREVLGLLGPTCSAYDLGLTREGQPRHPLYLPRATRPRRSEWVAPSRVAASGG